jgi:hypothetical protein
MSLAVFRNCRHVKSECDCESESYLFTFCSSDIRYRRFSVAAALSTKASCDRRAEFKFRGYTSPQHHLTTSPAKTAGDCIHTDPKTPIFAAAVSTSTAPSLTAPSPATAPASIPNVLAQDTADNEGIVSNGLAEFFQHGIGSESRACFDDVTGARICYVRTPLSNLAPDER